ncbi:hypothetical protein ABI59_19350 [Acidobacteria bacterium Mor1]|nr:hypothetical protein ABI59_19350 [Acidobacteria bacterium Mor1]
MWFCLLLAVPLSAAVPEDPKIEELETLLAGQQGADALDTLLELARSTSIRAPLRSLDYADRAEALIEGHPSDQRRFNLEAVRATAFGKRGEWEAAELHGRRALELAPRLDDPGAAIYARRRLGRALSGQERHEEALRILSEARELAEQGGDVRSRVVSAMSVGRGQIEAMRYEEAFETMLEAYLIADPHLDDSETIEPALVADLYNELGSIYHYTESYDRAIEYYRKALPHWEGQGQLEIVSLQNLAASMSLSGRYADTLEINERALALADEVEDRIGQAQIRMNIAFNLNGLGRSNEALEYSLAAVDYFERMDASPRWMAWARQGLAHSLLRTGEPVRARALLEDSLRIAEESGDRRLERSTVEHLAEVHTELGQPGQALMAQRRLQEIDQANREDRRRKLADLQARFELLKRDQHIERLEADLALDRLRLERERTIRIAMIVVAFAVGTLALMAWLAWRAQRASNSRLAETHRQLQQTHRNLVELNARAEAQSREIKILQGMLPICSSCKKIKDESGDWNQLEAYIDDHSEASFTHGYCPECAAATLRDSG